MRVDDKSSDEDAQGPVHCMITSVQALGLSMAMDTTESDAIGHVVVQPTILDSVTVLEPAHLTE